MRFSILIIALVTAATASAGEGGTGQRLIDIREVLKEFGASLSGQLKQAIEQGGPVNAINVCKSAAPGIASELSDKYGWRIGRTSLKTRNPDNDPDQWESNVLMEFEKRKQRGEPVTKLEYHQEVEVNGVKQFRYMKAIPTAGLCLTCHGTNIPGAVKAALAKQYPDDRATGFQAGDIRGAFTVIINE